MTYYTPTGMRGLTPCLNKAWFPKWPAVRMRGVNYMTCMPRRAESPLTTEELRRIAELYLADTEENRLANEDRFGKAARVSCSMT